MQYCLVKTPKYKDTNFKNTLWFSPSTQHQGYTVKCFFLVFLLAESWSSTGVALHQGEPQLAQLGTTCQVSRINHQELAIMNYPPTSLNILMLLLHILKLFLELMKLCCWQCCWVGACDAYIVPCWAVYTDNSYHDVPLYTTHFDNVAYHLTGKHPSIFWLNLKKMIYPNKKDTFMKKKHMPIIFHIPPSSVL